jgi:TetR/AcrR family transcriptional regulator, transcriptional repressor of aconitase
VDTVTKGVYFVNVLLNAEDDERSRVIVDAATSCFLQFGYAKTSLDDIAQRAGLSRPLLYRKSTNKEELFSAVYDEVHAKRYPALEAIVAGKGTPRSKLERVCEVIFVEPWALICKAPAVEEFYEACERVIPTIQDRHDKKQLELVDDILHDKELARVFLFAVEGMYSDLPSVTALRRRLAILCERFT